MSQPKSNRRVAEGTFSFVLAGILVMLLSACSDFFNSSKSGDGVGREARREGAPRPDKNPFPPGYEDPNAGAFSEEKMLVNIGVNVIAKAVDEFAFEASVLEKRIVAACSSASVGKNSAALRDAQGQWKRAMLSYHRVDSFPVGPLWANDKFLASRLYAWPLFNSCGIDAETVRVKEGTGTAVQDLPTPVRGLGAIEYLLFEPTFKSTCNARAYPQVVRWVALAEKEKRADRCALAVRIAGDVVAQSKALALEWDPEGRNFTRSFIDKTSPDMRTTVQSVNAVTDSLFQIEALKDVRLARPLGLHRDCVSETGKCPQDVEHSYSGLAVRAMEARLSAFGDAFDGHFGSKDGFGFDDLLATKGHAEVAKRLQALVRTARDNSAGLDNFLAGGGTAVTTPISLRDFVEAMDKDACVLTTASDRRVEACALYQDVRAITTALKTELLAVLALRAPPTYQGDND